MFRVIYQRRDCPDCREPSPRPVCECGYMRPLDDLFWITPVGAPVAWTRSGPWPRIEVLAEYDRRAIRDATFNRLDDGDGHGDGAGYGFANGDGHGGGWYRGTSRSCA